MSEVSTVYYKISQSGFLSKLNDFRSNVSRAFDTPLDTFITDTVTSMKQIYSQMLETFIATSYYYGSTNDFKYEGQGLQMWIIPVGIESFSKRSDANDLHLSPKVMLDLF